MFKVVYKSDWRGLLKYQMYACMKHIDIEFRDRFRAIRPKKVYWISIRISIGKSEIKVTWLNAKEATFFGLHCQTVFWIHYPRLCLSFWVMLEVFFLIIDTF